MKHIADVLATADEEQEWICNPYVGRESITFLHGKTSIGKSPLSWELARCVSQGIPFLGWPTAQSRVLYLEADTAEIVVRPRLRLMPQPIGNWNIAFFSGRTIDLKDPKSFIHPLFKEWRKDFEPELVIWNTLRQFYKGSAIDSDTVTQVYNAMLQSFPKAAHWVSAHDRKSSTENDTHEVEDEAFSGSAAWRDLAQVGLHLVKIDQKAGVITLRLDHTKTQLSEMMHSIRLTLAANGTTITSNVPPLERIEELWQEARCQGIKEPDTWVAERLNISLSTLYRLKKKLKRAKVSPL
jgi:hypothetical protein